MNKTIAIIPARGGSKKIPQKNIKFLNDIPLINYTINVALSNANIQRVIVSTDDSEIAKISEECGAEVPFLRPASIAQDKTPDRPVILHILDWLKNKENFNPDRVLYLRPTTPFKNNEIINKCLEKLNSNPTATSVRTVHKAEGIDHPYWMFRDKMGYIVPFIEGIDLSKYYQRQLLPECYKINGVVDIIKPEVVLNDSNMYGEKVSFIEINDIHAVDIDTQLDFEFAEFLLKKKMFPEG